MLWKPLDSYNFQNPYPMYERLREESPVFKAQTGEWVVSRYNEVKMILKDSRFLVGNKKEWINRGITYFDSKNEDFTPIAEALNSFILLLNPPEHAHLRNLVMVAWNNKDVEKIITNNVDYLLKPLKEKSRFDVVKSFTSHLPAMTIAKIMGIPMADYLHLREAGRNMIKAVNPYNTYKEFVLMNDAAKHFIKYFEHLIESKERTKGDDLICKIMQISKDSNQPLSRSQLISLCIFLFIAGEETTIGFTSSSIYTLGVHKEARERLRKHQNYNEAIEELLRYNGPVHLLGRIASEDMSFCNHTLKKGDVMTLCLASANRDENQFHEGDNLILERTPNRHIAFGSGIHFCLGDWLAKMQAKIALKAFTETFPTYNIDKSSVRWSSNLSIRAMEKLVVKVKPSTAEVSTI